MNPTLIATLLQILIQYGPASYQAAVKLFNNPAPTQADFLALLDSISQESYDAFIAAAKANKTATPVVVPSTSTSTAP